VDSDSRRGREGMGMVLLYRVFSQGRNLKRGRGREKRVFSRKKGGDERGSLSPLPDRGGDG